MMTSDLALYLMDARRPDKARLLLTKSLPAFKSVLGEEHPKTLTAMHNLARAMVYTKGRHGEASRNLVRAEELLQECGRLREKVLGRYCTSGITLRPTNDLQYSIDLLYNTPTTISRRHPDTLTTMMSYGCVLQSLGRLDEAIKCYEAALQGFVNALGPDAREVHTARENIKQARKQVERKMTQG